MKRIARRFPTILAALVFLCCWGIATPILAKRLVSGRYLVANGTRIELEVTISTPPPATLIITQSLPPDVTVISTTAPVKKFSQRPGEVKCLIMGSGPGIMVITMTLSKAVQSSQIGGELVYNDPATGAMVRLPITP